MITNLTNVSFSDFSGYARIDSTRFPFDADTNRRRKKFGCAQIKCKCRLPASVVRFVCSSIITNADAASITFKCIQQILSLVGGRYRRDRNRGRYLDLRRDFRGLFFHGLSAEMVPSLSPSFPLTLSLIDVALTRARMGASFESNLS